MGVQQQLKPFAPLHFDGGPSASATLSHHPIRDLNSMIRTAVVDGRIDIVELSVHRTLQLAGGRFGIFLRGRGGMLASDGTERQLERFDTVVGGGHEAPLVGGKGILTVHSVSPASEPPE